VGSSVRQRSWGQSSLELAAALVVGRFVARVIGINMRKNLAGRSPTDMAPNSAIMAE